jgi:hydroxylamine dehydrogenase
MAIATIVVLAAAQLVAAVPEASKVCVDCHRRERIAATSMETWRTSRHAAVGVACADCHLAPGADDLASLCPAPGVHREVAAPACGRCHPEQAEQFASGRHARAWTALLRVREEIPALTTSATRGCELCHRIGASGGRCDYCHTRHAFAPAEARRPESCRPCHQGANHPEWEMFSLSRHGSLYTIEGGHWDWSHPIEALYGGREPSVEHPPRVPVCATCHMARGRHQVPSVDGPTMLGFAGDDPGWRADETAIRRHFGLDPLAAYTPNSEPRTTDAAPPAPLARAFPDLLSTCGGCHTRSFAAAQMTAW